MKKNLFLIVALALFAGLILSGCQFTDLTMATSAPPEAVTPSSLTKEDVIGYFESSPNNEGFTVVDCVLADDGAYDLAGVVQYTDLDFNSCNLSFIKKDTFGHPIGLDPDSVMTLSEDSILTYLGDGEITFTLQEKDTKKVFDYIIAYSHIYDDEGEVNGIHFVASSTERIK